MRTDIKLVRGVFAFNAAMIKEVCRLFDEHKLHPIIAKVFEWKDAKEAFKYSMEWSGVGKTVIRVGS